MRIQKRVPEGPPGGTPKITKIQALLEWSIFLFKNDRKWPETLQEPPRPHLGLLGGVPQGGRV